MSNEIKEIKDNSKSHESFKNETRPILKQVYENSLQIEKIMEYLNTLNIRHINKSNQSSTTSLSN